MEEKMQANKEKREVASIEETAAEAVTEKANLEETEKEPNPATDATSEAEEVVETIASQENAVEENKEGVETTQDEQVVTIHNTTSLSSKNTHNNDDGSDDDDDAGWITPDNIGQIKRVETKTANIDELVKRKKVGVACITTDYAMQNILIQMGLHLVSADGMVIKRLRTYLLQCHACFNIPSHPSRTTKDMERVFCPNCGHLTLRKVPYVLDERTGQPILLANRVSHPVSIRGTKFSLPLPKGGRQEQKLILREDELLQYGTRRRKKKNSEDAFDEDHAFLQPRHLSQAKYVIGKPRNSNENRRRTGKRKKKSGGLN